MGSSEVPVGTIECLDEERQLYRVEGRTGTYFVEPDRENPPHWRCTCPSYVFRLQAQGKPCRHQHLVLAYLEALEACPVCRGRAWLLPSRLIGYVDRYGCPDDRPAPCVECSGTGKRRR